MEQESDALLVACANSARGLQKLGSDLSRDVCFVSQLSNNRTKPMCVAGRCVCMHGRSGACVCMQLGS